MSAQAARPRQTRVSRSPKRRRLATRAGAVTTSMSLPRTLHERASVTALRLNWTLSEVIRTALSEWLDRHEVTAEAQQ